MTTKVTQQQLNRLPEDLKNLWGSMKSTEEVHQIGNKYSLTEQEKNRLDREVGAVLLGLTYLNDFKNSLGATFSQKEEGEIIKIHEEIMKKILAPVKISLLKIQEKKRGGDISTAQKEEEGGAAPTRPHSIIEERLQGNISTPKQQTKLTEREEQGSSHEPSGKPENEEENKNRPGFDPYRESPESQSS